jgi:hypothetical protein
VLQRVGRVIGAHEHLNLKQERHPRLADTFARKMARPLHNGQDSLLGERGFMRGTHGKLALLVVFALVGAICMTSPADARGAPLGVTITSISPNPFTPTEYGHDPNHRANIHIRIASTQNIALYALNSRGVSVSQHRFGVYKKGSYTFWWAGRNQDGTRVVPFGVYTIVVKTSAASRRGQDSATVRVGPKPPPPKRTTDVITYHVTGQDDLGDGYTTAFVTLETPTGSTQVDVTTPWQRTYTFKRGAFVYVSPQNDYGGSVSCSIVAIGKTISKNTATGDYAIATCDGAAP